MYIDPTTGEVIETNEHGLIIYDPNIANDFSQGLARAGLKKEDLVLLKSEERQEVIRFIAAQGLGYETPEDLLAIASETTIDQWRLLCGYISIIDADVAEEVAVRFLYDAWKVDPTTERLMIVLDHVLNETNQGRYFRTITDDSGETSIRAQPPFYMLNGFFNAVYLNRMTLDRIISIFKHDVDWQAGTVRKAAEMYGAGVSTVMRQRNVIIQRLTKQLELANPESEQVIVIEGKVEEIENITDEKLAQLGRLYDNAGRVSTAVFRPQKNRILGRRKALTDERLTSDVIIIVERYVPVSAGMATTVRFSDRQINIGGYKEIKILLPLAEDGTDLPIYGVGYIEQLKALVEQYKLLQGEEK